MSNILFTSDTHFGHEKIIKYSNRPFQNVQEMDEALIQNWNRLVGPRDTVWHLGDFSFLKFSDLQKLLPRLNGDIHLVLGNHDQKRIIPHTRELLSQGKIKSIQSYAEIEYGEHFFCLFHYGQRVWNRSHYGSFHLYGHSHGGLPPHGKSVDVGVDCREITDEYRPVTIDEVITYLSAREGAGLVKR